MCLLESVFFQLLLHIFFNYHTIYDRSVQGMQKLMISFNDYPTVLIKMLNSVIKEPHIHLAILILHGDSLARLDFIQNMEYKFVELMSCDCEGEMI